MKILSLSGLAGAALLAAAGAASAQEAITTNDVNMRAGPGTRFPVVTTIPEERPVMIHGCLADYDWCDVSWRRERGWVFSDYLDYLYNDRPVTFYEYRRRTGVPVVTFGYGYWDRYYRARPWFDDWDRWGGERRWSDRRQRYDRGGEVYGNDRQRLDSGDWNRQESRNRNTDLTDENWSDNTRDNRQRSRDRFDDGSDGRTRDRVNRDRCDDFDPSCQTGSITPRNRNRQNSVDYGDGEP